MKHTVLPWTFAGFKTCLDEHCNDFGADHGGFVWRQCRRTGVKIRVGVGSKGDEDSKWHVLLCGRLEPVGGEIPDAGR